VNVLLLGPQGSGKGTQAKRIAAEHGIPHVSTGEIFRVAIASGSELGQRVAPVLERGDLVPDELTIELIRERLAEDDAADGFILDGFPRNFAQAEALDTLLSEIGRELDLVLYFQLDDEVGIRRMVKRAEDEGRTDDTPEAMRRRLDIYHRETEPLAEYYRAKDILVPLRADRTIDAVWAEVQDALEQVEARIP
jgi:adenylate kinase